MRRNALMQFLRRVAITAPLLAGGCNDNQCSVLAHTDPVPLPDVDQISVKTADVDAGTCTGALAPSSCLGAPDTCQVVMGDGGWVALVHYPGFTYPCDHPCRGGRRPEGFVVDGGERSSTALGRHFARMAQTEAASVIAFGRLATELQRFGAPRSLQRAARAARGDEERHARIFSSLAARHGAQAARVEASPARSRSLLEIARENVVEGCVRESFGAAEALFASQHAGSLSLRRAMAGIARDDARHAALAWAVDEWVRPRFSAIEKRQLDDARGQAIADLCDEAHRDPPSDVKREAGVPAAHEASELLAIARATLWS